MLARFGCESCGRDAQWEVVGGDGKRKVLSSRIVGRATDGRNGGIVGVCGVQLKFEVLLLWAELVLKVVGLLPEAYEALTKDVMKIHTRDTINSTRAEIRCIENL